MNSNVTIDNLTVDDQVLTSHLLSDEEIVASVRSSAEEQSLSISPPTKEEDVDEPPPVVSDKEAQEALLTLRRFLQQQEDTGDYFDLYYSIRMCC